MEDAPCHHQGEVNIEVITVHQVGQDIGNQVLRQAQRSIALLKDRMVAPPREYLVHGDDLDPRRERLPVGRGRYVVEPTAINGDVGEVLGHEPCVYDPGIPAVEHVHPQIRVPAEQLCQEGRAGILQDVTYSSLNTRVNLQRNVSLHAQAAQMVHHEVLVRRHFSRRGLEQSGAEDARRLIYRGGCVFDAPVVCQSRLEPRNTRIQITPKLQVKCRHPLPKIRRPVLLQRRCQPTLLVDEIVEASDVENPVAVRLHIRQLLGGQLGVEDDGCHLHPGTERRCLASVLPAVGTDARRRIAPLLGQDLPFCDAKQLPETPQQIAEVRGAAHLIKKGADGFPRVLGPIGKLRVHQVVEEIVAWRKTGRHQVALEVALVDEVGQVEFLPARGAERPPGVLVVVHDRHISDGVNDSISYTSHFLSSSWMCLPASMHLRERGPAGSADSEGLIPRRPSSPTQDWTRPGPCRAA